MFSCIEHYVPVWKEKKGVSSVELVGESKSSSTPEPIQVSLSATIEAFKSKYDHYKIFYQSFLEQKILERFEEIKQIESSPVNFSSEIWARTVYSFVAEFHKNPSYGKDTLIDALRVLWIGRVGVFLKETAELTREESESKITEEAKVFQDLKGYFFAKY
jgi:hypothetical protein